MAKYAGKIGYLMTVEKPGSIWEEEVIEKDYYGDVFRHVIKRSSSDKLNDDITISDEISIVADSFAYENAQYMKYITYMNARWCITSMSIGHPRITLTIGGLYNAPKGIGEREYD